MKNMFKYFVIATLCVFYPAQAELIDSIRLIDEEAKLINGLLKYLDAENARLDQLQRYATALTSGDEDLEMNPLGIYRIVKHLTVDLDDVKRNMSKNTYDDIMPGLLEETNAVLPDTSNLYSTIHNLIHLQRMYNLTVQDVMNGRLVSDVTANSTLTHEDCYYIGKESFEKNDYVAAVEWLQQYESVSNEATPVSEMLLSSAFHTGNLELCQKMVSKCLRKNSNSRKLSDLNLKLTFKLGTKTQTEEDQWESFNTCAGDHDNEMAHRNMKCRYNHHNSPFLVIAPLKEEMLSLAPKVSLFREAVYDSEIHLLKTNANERFRVARVVSGNTSVAHLDYRFSQSAFLDNRQSQYSSLWNRLQDLSSLSLTMSEAFQMLQYPPGGFYRVHADYFSELSSKETRGNRIATALMYLNDVTLGGNTVFPRLKLNVLPAKGSILFWINMRVNDSEEVLSKHAACPVIYGEKIACTQWFRRRGQDHWIAELEDEMKPTNTVNPNIICRK